MTRQLTREALEAVLGFRVLNWPGSYVTAFTHKTAVGKPGAGACSFEKLEFLGDAVLGFVVGRHLYESYAHHADVNEGFMTQLRTKLVSGKALAEIARRMGLADLVLVSDKAMRSGIHENPRILEDVLEALIGAVFLDAGMVAARTFVLHFIQTHVDHSTLSKNHNYKDQLMQYCHARAQPLPSYVATPGAHFGSFHVTAEACGAGGGGDGTTKRAAEQLAARNVLIALHVHVDM